MPIFMKLGLIIIVVSIFMLISFTALMIPIYWSESEGKLTWTSIITIPIGLWGFASCQWAMWFSDPVWGGIVTNAIKDIWSQ